MSSLPDSPQSAEGAEILKRLLSSRRTARCRIASGSMRPLLQVGDFVEVTPVGSVAELNRFDILVFSMGSDIFCHYFWRINGIGSELCALTRSLQDRRQCDLPVPMSRILGKVSSHRIPFHLKARIIIQSLWMGTA